MVSDSEGRHSLEVHRISSVCPTAPQPACAILLDDAAMKYVARQDGLHTVLRTCL